MTYIKKRHPKCTQDFNDILRKELAERLKREPTSDEIINSQYDGNLIVEILFQIIADLYERVEKLEKKP